MRWFASSGVRQSTLRFAPRLEALEDRSCPSCTTSLTGTTLTILGDQAVNTIQITDDGSGTLQVTCDGAAADSFDAVTKVVVRGGASGDAITYELTGSRSTPLSLDIAGQQGADQININLNAGLLAGADLEITVNAGNGADVLALNAQNADVAAGATLAVTLNGNNAKDVTTFDYQGNINGELKLKAEGGNGVDSITADVTGDVALGATLDMFFGAGNGQDSISATYAGAVNGDLKLEAHGGLGPDDVSADLTINAGSTGSVHAFVEGNNGKDNLTLLVHDNSGDDGDPSTVDASTLALLDAVVQTGHGHDNFNVTDNVTVIH